MAFTSEGKQVIAYDEVRADELVETDRILIDNDPVEVEEILPDHGVRMIKGVSHLTRKSVEVIFLDSHGVLLWREA